MDHHPDYNRTVEWLFACLPMFTRDGASAYKKDLANTLALCEALENPQNKFRTIHIAGTNGKGSTSTGIAAFLQTAGYKTGLYTSPHLIDFRERIRINGELAPEAFVVDFVNRIRPEAERIQPSFFELTVAMAFEWFAVQQVDFAVIETGLGGRLDSTNVILPELSVITNIAFDHMALLGNTLPEIAGEKAGIIKPNVPVIIGERHAETENIFMEKAAAENAPVLFAEDRWRVDGIAFSGKGRHYRALNLLSGQDLTFESTLSGDYQQQNLATIFAAIEVLAQQGYRVKPEDAADALADLSRQGLHGRYEVLQNDPLIVADVAHNPQGLEQVLAQWQAGVAGRKHLVLGFVRDKDVASALALFPADATYYFCQAQIPRALPVEELQSQADEAGLTGAAYCTVEAAVKAARAALQESDALLITGSFFIVGEALTSFSESGLPFSGLPEA